MIELVPALKNTLFSPTYELAFEDTEISIDTLLDNEMLKISLLLALFHLFAKLVITCMSVTL